MFFFFQIKVDSFKLLQNTLFTNSHLILNSPSLVLYSSRYLRLFTFLLGPVEEVIPTLFYTPVPFPSITSIYTFLTNFGQWSPGAYSTFPESWNKNSISLQEL